MKMNTLMKVARVISGDSKCMSRQVGVVIARDGRIISTGINGTSSGLRNCDEVMRHNRMTNSEGLTEEGKEFHHEWSKSNEIHAEMNAILFAAKHGLSIEGATMFTTLAPCADCAKAITQSGIRKVIYGQNYDRNSEDWQTILRKSNVEVYFIGEE